MTHKISLAHSLSQRRGHAFLPRGTKTANNGALGKKKKISTILRELFSEAAVNWSATQTSLRDYLPTGVLFRGIIHTHTHTQINQSTEYQIWAPAALKGVSAKSEAALVGFTAVKWAQGREINLPPPREKWVLAGIPATVDTREHGDVQGTRLHSGRGWLRNNE